MSAGARHQGFTLVELTIVISILAVVIPGTYVLYRTFQDQYLSAIARMQSATGARSIGEELRRDVRTHRMTDATDTKWVLESDTNTECPRIEYVLEAERLVRKGKGCGAERGLARNVARIGADETGVQVDFELRLRPQRSRHFEYVIGLPEGT